MRTKLAHVHFMLNNGATIHTIEQWLAPITTPQERRDIIATLNPSPVLMAA